MLMVIGLKIATEHVKLSGINLLNAINPINAIYLNFFSPDISIVLERISFQCRKTCVQYLLKMLHCSWDLTHHCMLIVSDKLPNPNRFCSVAHFNLIKRRAFKSVALPRTTLSCSVSMSWFSPCRGGQSEKTTNTNTSAETRGLIQTSKCNSPGV